MASTQEEKQAARTADPSWLEPDNPADVNSYRQKLDILWNEYSKQRWTLERRKEWRSTLQQFLAIAGATISILVGGYTIYSNFFAA